MDHPNGADAFLERVGEKKILGALLVVALVSHTMNMFGYPLYLGDEGIYTEQAWAVLRLGKLAPYTYFYDHAPAGWLMLAAWTFLLPKGFFTFGPSIASGRVLMLLVHLVSVVLLFRITRSLSGSMVAAIAATLFFVLSPLSVYYGRMVLLDNLMVLWVLLALYLVLRSGTRLVRILASGAALGIAMLTKEDAIFFLPVMAYLLVKSIRSPHLKRFTVGGWIFAVVMVASLYPLYALLKNELLPPGAGFIVNSAPAQHVSLLGTVVWQLGRSGGSVLDPYSDFWFYFWGKWWAKDSVLIVVGMAAAMLNLLVGYLRHDRHQLVASLLCLSFAVYLARGSVILEFYVVPILPFLALNAGFVVGFLGKLPSRVILPVLTLAASALAALFVYTARDIYVIDLTGMQARQMAWIQQNIPPSATLVVDDDLWVDLHDPSGATVIYPRAHSHWKVNSDPAVQMNVLQNDWRRVDYMIMSDQLLNTFHVDHETLPLQIYANSSLVATFAEGKVQLEIRKVVK